MPLIGSPFNPGPPNPAASAQGLDDVCLGLNVLLVGPTRCCLTGMRMLVLGGTAWLGAHVVAAAAAAGHEVTCLARGISGAAPPGAAFLSADRTRPGCYDQVSTRPWDLVIDLSRQPGQVKGAVEALVGQATFFVFVSSGNA